MWVICHIAKYPTQGLHHIFLLTFRGFGKIDLNEQIEAVINDIKNQINIRYNNNAIKLLFEAQGKQGNGVSIKADKVRIQEVISNLLNNAIKFTNEGTIYITTEKKKTDRGDEVIVKIKDTGIVYLKEFSNMQKNQT